MPNDRDKPAQPRSENEGEGNKTSAKEYDQAAERFARSGKVDPAARDAREALDREGEELQRAEDEGRRHIAEEDPEITRKH